jgi:hypothetical protein
LNNKQILAPFLAGDHFELRNLGNEFGFEESLFFAFFLSASLSEISNVVLSIKVNLLYYAILIFRKQEIP